MPTQADLFRSYCDFIWNDAGNAEYNTWADANTTLATLGAQAHWRTCQHYIAIAQVLHETQGYMSQSAAANLRLAFADMLQKDNPSFEYTRFTEAALFGSGSKSNAK